MRGRPRNDKSPPGAGLRRFDGIPFYGTRTNPGLERARFIVAKALAVNAWAVNACPDSASVTRHEFAAQSLPFPRWSSEGPLTRPRTARRGRSYAAVALSLGAHVAVLAVLATQAPRLLADRDEGGPPEAIIPVLILPRTPPMAGQPGKPTPVRLHRRRQRTPLEDLPVAPLLIPEARAPASLPAPAPAAVAPPRPAEDLQLRQALKSGTFGCANPRLLSRQEREKCEEQLGRGAAEAPFIPPGAGMTREKRALLDAAGKARAARIAQREAPLAHGLSKAEPVDYDGEIPMSGVGAPDPTYQKAPSKRAAPRLGRLPP